MHCVANRTSAQEEARLEQCVRREVEDGCGPCTDTESQGHVTELADG